MFVHRVAQGECFASIAHRYGYPDAATLFDHPDNADLKELRKTPYVLRAGDQIVIPEREEKWQEGCATGRLHTFRAKVPKVMVRWHLHEPQGGAPLADTKYLLRIAGVADIEGTTDGDGLVEEEVPPNAQSAELFLFIGGAETEAQALVLRVDIGHLDPIDEMSGVQARLNNVGFRCAVTGALDEDTRRALAAFQEHEGLDATGDVDDATRDKLRAHHRGT